LPNELPNATHRAKNDELEDDNGPAMRIEDRRGESLPETTISVDDEELIDLLQGLADVVEGKRDHLHFAQPGGPQLVVRRAAEGDSDPLRRQMDWWLGPLVLVGALFVIVGAVTILRWAIGLLS
jgi:hypothetical protein